VLIADLGDEGERQLELRLLEVRHAPEYHRLVCANLARLYWLPAAPSLADAENRIRAGLGRLAEGSGFDGGIFERGVLVGFAGLFRIDPGQQSGEIGYWIDRASEGRGLVTRACRALVDYGFTELGLHRIELHCGATNSRSQAVAERLGFRLEGRRREADRVGDHWDDFLVYGLLAGEWAVNKLS
jgi:ribosomal-protein-serine acetyltransferase